MVYGVMCTHHGNVVTMSLSEPGIEYTTTHDSHGRRKRGLRKEEVDVWRTVLVSWSHDQAGSAVAGRCAIKRLSPVCSYSVAVVWCYCTLGRCSLHQASLLLHYTLHWPSLSLSRNLELKMVAHCPIIVSHLPL